MKLAGAVVLYNPQKNVIENINSYIDSVDKLLMVDNSEQSNEWLLEFSSNKDNVHYFSQTSNRGIAYALNFAAEQAKKFGYNYLLTMDQDSRFKIGVIDKLAEFIENNNNVGIVSPLHQNRFNSLYYGAENHIERLAVKASGNIIDLNIFKKIGGFSEDFFIDYVDIEYCLKLWDKGFKVVQLNNAVLDHSEADLTKKKIFGKTVYPYNHSPIRMYYKTRNHFFLKKLYARKFKEYFDVDDRYFRNNFIKIFLYENNKIRKVYYSILGYYHYLLNKRGKIS